MKLKWSLNKIDPKCREFVYFLNKYGYTTSNSCQGHEGKYNFSYMIMFAPEVTEEQINQLVNLCPYGKIFLWKRSTGGPHPEILTNWIYEVNSYSDCKTNQALALKDCKNFLKYYRGLKNETNQPQRT